MFERSISVHIGENIGIATVRLWVYGFECEPSGIPHRRLPIDCAAELSREHSVALQDLQSTQRRAADCADIGTDSPSDTAVVCIADMSFRSPDKWLASYQVKQWYRFRNRKRLASLQAELRSPSKRDHVLLWDRPAHERSRASECRAPSLRISAPLSTMLSRSV